MQLLALGLNHTTAPLSIREAVAFSPEEIPGALSALRTTYARPEEGGIREALILSTCNRTEFFLAAENGDAALHSLCSFVARQKGIDLKEFLPHTYEYRQSDVARHTFRVASGLDSMVLGETQIVGQMKKAWRIARESKSLGLMLGHLLTVPLLRQRKSVRRPRSALTRCRSPRPVSDSRTSFSAASPIRMCSSSVPVK